MISVSFHVAGKTDHLIVRSASRHEQRLNCGKPYSCITMATGDGGQQVDLYISLENATALRDEISQAIKNLRRLEKNRG